MIETFRALVNMPLASVLAVLNVCGLCKSWTLTLTLGSKLWPTILTVTMVGGVPELTQHIGWNSMVGVSGAGWTSARAGLGKVTTPTNSANTAPTRTSSRPVLSVDGRTLGSDL